MADSPMCFTIITDKLSSNTSPHMVVPFLLVPLHLQGKFQDGDMERVQTTTNKFKAQSKT